MSTPPKPTIAFVEDVADNAEIIKILIEQGLGFSAAIFKGGAAFLAALRHAPFDVVLLDIAMPEMDGFEVLQELRKIHPRIPVIALTAYAYESDRNKALEAGFDDYVTKPIRDLGEFKRLLEKYLNRAAAT
jgi:CheY-like chemotaxis protein